MTDAKFKEAFREKLQEEQKAYTNRLCRMEPQKILANAYEYSVRADILYIFEKKYGEDDFGINLDGLTPEQQSAALFTPDLLGKIVETFSNDLSGYMNTLAASVNKTIAKSAEAIQSRDEHDELPERCYVWLETTDEIGVITRGKSGYLPTPKDAFTIRPGESGKEIVDMLNKDFGVTPAQASAMAMGSMFGWDTKAADPKSYDENGVVRADAIDDLARRTDHPVR